MINLSALTAPFLSLAFFCLSGCVNVPKGVSPVNDFEVDKYLGQWYEIARLDHSFERGLENISATYTLRDDKGINVLNRGYNVKKKTWKEAKGKAYFVDQSSVGFLKVSFFGPFYGAYVVFDLDENYQTALVSGPNKSYFWILSRTPNIPDNTLATLIKKAKDFGFDTDNLIYVNHDTPQ